MATKRPPYRHIAGMTLVYMHYKHRSTQRACIELSMRMVSEWRRGDRSFGADDPKHIIRCWYPFYRANRLYAMALVEQIKETYNAS